MPGIGSIHDVILERVLSFQAMFQLIVWCLFFSLQITALLYLKISITEQRALLY
jgi:hypothetical protein